MSPAPRVGRETQTGDCRTDPAPASPAPVLRAYRNPCACQCAQLRATPVSPRPADHRRSSTVMTRSSTAVSTLVSTTMRRPLTSAISMLPHTQVEYWISGEVNERFRPQLQGQLYVSQRSWVDIVCWHDVLPKPDKPEPNRRFRTRCALGRAGYFWMICRFTSAWIFPQRGCKLNEPNGFEPLWRVHDRIIRALSPINFAHKR
jgi:hypothetical protein